MSQFSKTIRKKLFSCTHKILIFHPLVKPLAQCKPYVYKRNELESNKTTINKHFVSTIYVILFYVRLEYPNIKISLIIMWNYTIEVKGYVQYHVLKFKIILNNAKLYLFLNTKVLKLFMTYLKYIKRCIINFNPCGR